MDSFIELPTPAPLVALIDKQAGVRVSTSDLASAERRGLLWLLDEEAIFPGATGTKQKLNFSAYISNLISDCKKKNYQNKKLAWDWDGVIDNKFGFTLIHT